MEKTEHAMLPESVVAKWVRDRIENRVILHSIGHNLSHWTSSLVAIMSRMNYVPERSLLAREGKLPKDVSYVDIVTRGVSQALLDDLDLTIDAAEVSAGLTSVRSIGEEGVSELFIGKNGSMLYAYKQPVAADPKEDRGEGWGCW